MATATTPDTIVAHWNPKLPTMWEAKIQQQQNALLPYVTPQDLDGKITFIDQIGPLAVMTPITQRFQRLEVLEGNYDRRAIKWKAFSDTRGFDQYDEIKLGSQKLPVSELMQEQAYLGHRTAEKGILDAITGTNWAGENGDQSITLGADRIIEWNFNYDGTTTARGMTLDKFARARRMFYADYAYGQGLTNGSDQLVAALAAAQIEDMVQDARMSGQYDVVYRLEQLKNFEVDTFMGVKILHTEQATTRLESSTVIRQVPFWLKSKVKFGFAKNWTSRMWIQEMMNFAILMNSQFAFGGSRLEEKGVLIVECVENPV